MDRTRLVTRYDERPADETPIHTTELPPTPTRDRNIKATAWIEAPASLLELGNDLPDQPVADCKRRTTRPFPGLERRPSRQRVDCFTGPSDVSAHAGTNDPDA